MSQFFYGLDTHQLNVWDALDRRVQKRVPVPANIQQFLDWFSDPWRYFKNILFKVSVFQVM